MRTVGSRSRSLVTWLLIAQAVVLCVTAVVATVAAAVIGPPLFHEHLHLAGSDTSGSTFDHVEEAFRSAGLLTLGAALLAAIAAAGLVTVVLGRRLTGPLQELASAATRVADGHYGATVAQPTRLSELAAVGTAFNRMSAQLASTEQVRQQMLSDLGHELRTPLATIQVYLDAADDDVTSGHELTAVLREQVTRLDRLTRDINAISRADESAITLERNPIDVAELLASVTGPRQEHLRARGLTLDVSAPSGTTLRGDRLRLQQVLTNLLDNAERHTADGGRIRVTVRPEPQAVSIEVADDGDGIGEEHLAHVFERFYRTDTARDRDHGGAGIGLAICRSVVLAHGGSITAHSNGFGTGARFRITLPTP